MHDFYSAAAQVLPVLVLAIVFEYRAMTGRGLNVYAAFGFPMKMSAAPLWFKGSYLLILLLMPISLFAGELAALHALSINRPGNGSHYWIVGGLIIGGVFALLPFVLEGIREVFFMRYEMKFGETMWFLLAALAAGLTIYCVCGLVVVLNGISPFRSAGFRPLLGYAKPSGPAPAAAPASPT